MAYIQSLYRQRAPNATVRGAITAVRAVEDMEWVKPIVSMKLWRMAKYLLPGDSDDRWTFGGLETLQLISQGCKDRVHWTFYGLAVLSFVGVLCVGQTVSVRRRGLGEDAMCFRGVRNSRRLFTRDLGTYAAAGSDWLKKHATREKGSIFIWTGLVGGTDHMGARGNRIRRTPVALLAQGRHCPAQVDGGSHRHRPVVGQVGVPPSCSGLPPPPPFHLHPPWPFRYTKVKRKTTTPFDLWPAAISEHFTKELPPSGGPGLSVQSKRARVEAPACRHAIKTGATVRRTTRCQKRNVAAGAWGDGCGKELL